MSMKLSRFTGGNDLPLYADLRELFTPFQRDFFKSPIWPQAGGEKILLLYGDFFAVFTGNLAKNFQIFTTWEKDPPTIRRKNRRFGWVFSEMFTKSSKIHHRWKRFPYYTQKNTLLLRQSREKFFIFRYSACRLEKDPPTIRTKSRRFDRPLFKIVLSVSLERVLNTQG